MYWDVHRARKVDNAVELNSYIHVLNEYKTVPLFNCLSSLVHIQPPRQAVLRKFAYRAFCCHTFTQHHKKICSSRTFSLVFTRRIMFQTLSTPLLTAVFTNATRLNGSGGKRRFSVISSCRASSTSSSSSSGSDENSFAASAIHHHRSSRRTMLSLTASLPLIVSTTFKGEGDFLLPLISNNIAFAGEENTDSSGQVIQNPQDLGDGFKRFYGEATSSSSYGGYGGSDNNFDKFKYYFEIPSSYEKDVVNKTEKSTNGTDARWVNPKDKRAEKAYCITLPGYMKLKDDRMGTFQDLALSDYTLQDAIYVVDGEPTVNDRYVGKTEPDQEGKGGSPGQLYADYDLVGMDSFGHIFATITVYGGRLYSLFVWVPPGGNVEDGKRMRDSFRTIENVNQEQMKADMEFYRRS